MKYILIGIVAIAIVSLSIWWTIYKYEDCKLVGHTKTYCVMKLFGN